MNWYIPNMGYQENFLPYYQKKMGHDVEIICSNKAPNIVGFKENIKKIDPDNFIRKKTCIDNGIKINRLDSIQLGGEFLIFKELYNKLSTLKPDIVHAHGTYLISSMQVAFWSEKLGFKVCIDDHSNENNLMFYHKPLFKLLRYFYKQYPEKVCCFIPVTESAESNLKNIWKIPQEKMKKLNLGVNTEIFKPSQKLRENCRAELKIEDSEILLISSGKFSEHKDIEILLNAFNIIQIDNSNIKLLLVGNGPKEYMEKLKSIINLNSLEDNIIFKDFVKNEDLPKYYNAADIGIWPGHHSITVVEACATGLPLVLPNNLKAYDPFFETHSAIRFERGNYESLSRNISNLIKNLEQRKRLSKNALKLTKDQFTWAKLAETSIDIYESCQVPKFG